MENNRRLYECSQERISNLHAEIRAKDRRIAELEGELAAKGDLRHYCELSPSLTRSQKTQVCAHMKRYSKRRRAAKDLLRLLTPIWEFMQANKPFRGAMGTIANKTNNQLQQIKGQRVYTPRVLEELFNDRE